ncbi:TetR family transcriptional regulator [Stackebrandtia albiflava]|uniref:TetR family transcriptional regulator n=1 Tax=Stackebrandtia albiflava TaxID=406432 RepID=A0A562V2A5_9ACTN|nr:TetR/AcrR family transcriptional regulator [Stackebrandtia albiflava]TWJ12001.1 TetR family transcriptional regulator [Stackebrandtia albiflava]
MSAVSERRERERAQRHRLIVTAARELAESEGWDAVTTRRLAERVEYSQPVLYSHFAGKEAIVGAVALEGFGELAARLGGARREAPEPGRAALHAVCGAYLDFAEAHPALYQAMFHLPNDLRFASDETPAPMRACFDEFVHCFRPDGRPELFAEVTWSALHGMAVLSDTARVRREEQAERLDLLVARLADAP